jgi:4-hydroxy-tetrahydrodipicolinate reductase
MNVLITGASGKMGSLIKGLLEKDTFFNEVYGFDRIENKDENIFSNLSRIPNVHVIIDFSTPLLLDELIEYSTKNNVPLVIATTGYTEIQKKRIEEASQTIPIFYSANYSYGVAIITEVLKQVSAKLERDFDIEIVEKHHHHKLDAPSGTSLHLAHAINSSLKSKKEIVNGHQGQRKPLELAIHAVRGGSIVGEHQVIFAGLDEVIEITHNAQSKSIFAHGAIKAAKFIIHQKKGFYTMNDLIKEDI